mgnify:CR=1 FL=1
MMIPRDLKNPGFIIEFKKLLAAEKEEVINLYPGGVPYRLKVDLDNPLHLQERPVEIDEYKKIGRAHV